MANGCVVCGSVLRGRQSRFCSKSCRNSDSNLRLQNYTCQSARGLSRKLGFIALRGGACQRCGYRSNHAALVWHHREPAKKKFELSIRAMSNRSLHALEAELAKCDLLCQNCHMEVHHPSAAMT